MTTEAMEDYFRIGVITRPHGVLGEMKVYPVTDDIKRFKGMKEIFMGPPEGRKGSLSAGAPGSYGEDGENGIGRYFS